MATKLLKHVNLIELNGKGRVVVAGTIPEAVWTECCANLNEMNLVFNEAELDCYKVGAYIPVCNGVLEDNDVDLADQVLVAIAVGIGLAVDKAILYGTGTKMPLGVVTRLAQATKPADYPATAREWVDLHTSNIKTIAAAQTGVALFASIITNFGAAKGKYSRGEKVFVMNETTWTALQAAGLSINAAGAIVTGMNGRMPVIGGIVEVLNFVPDNVIIGGFFDLYLFGQRRDLTLAQSEHAMFIQDMTVFKGTMRADGLPVIAEGFVAIGINGVTPNATMSFAPDTANQGE
jgi:HK97 family phage major capsid protein